MRKLKFVKVTLYSLWVIFVFLFTPCAANEKYKKETFTEVQNNKQPDKMTKLKYRGVVYDVGLQYNSGSYSVETFNPDLIKYDLSVIVNELHANTVRIEGEDISRLVSATEIAHAAGLKVFFNPWKMGANAEETVAYMKEAAIAAEKLRIQGIDLVFVAGCEYSFFSKGVFQGETLNERIAFMIKNATNPAYAQGKSPELTAAYEKLNVILSDICKVVRTQFKGSVTYASGTWEEVNWDLFDIIGVDYYRNGESEQQYVDGLKRYKSSKPLLVMEVGSCTYEGAAARGGGGFAIIQGTNPDGTIKYEGGITPIRSEKEQAGYVATQVDLLSKTDAEGVFIFVFAFPIMYYSEFVDLDMTSFSLVKSFRKEDPRSQKIPSWEPKEAYKRLAEVYSKMAKTEE
jgi:hypothetical protein